MAEITEKERNPNLITIFIKKPLKLELVKWLDSQVRLINIGDEAIGINFDYSELLTVTNKLEAEKLTPEKDFMVISNG